MFKVFNKKVGAKIASGYVIMLILMVAISLLASTRLRQVDKTVGNLTRQLSVEKDFSAEISLRILWMRYYANRYVAAQQQEDLDQFNDHYTRLKNVIGQMKSLISDPERAQMVTSIEQDVTEYGSAFSKAAELIHAEQEIESGVLDMQGLILDNNFSALRVHIVSLNDAAVFLAFGTAQTSYQTLRLNALKYVSRSDERYSVLAEKNYSTAKTSMAGLKASLSDPVQRANVDEAQKALTAYYEGFQSIVTDETQLRKLFNSQLNYLEPKISDEATQINNSVNDEFEQANQQSQNLVAQTQTGLFVATVSAIIAGSLLAFFLPSSITRPLGRVKQASHQLANTDIRAFTTQMASLAKGDVRLNLSVTAQPLDVQLEDEVGQTAQSFNEIVASLHETEIAFRNMAAYLNEMAKAAQSVGQGDLSVEIVPRSSDDVLGNAILDMLGDLRAAQKQVKETQDHLEELVAQRTWELKEAKNTAEAATRSKSVFLANMSHELRTPLNAILGFAQLMSRDADLLPRQRENLETIELSGEHLLALINDVLEMSKIEAGRITLHSTSFDLYRLLAILESMFRLRAAEENLQLNFEIDPDTPQAIRADEGKLRQVLINLLSNAIKFTQQGGVNLRLRHRFDTHFSSPVILEFEVEDSGVGIAPEDIAILFNPFMQTATGQKSQEGTGLGLAISYQFVNLMGGGMKVSSGIDRGSIFSFFIPVDFANLDEIEQDIETGPARRVIGLAPGQPAFRILIVEDKEASRRLMVKLLTPIGFEVREATNGQEAIKTWEQWQPHLVWMDMRMPVMDGHEATKRIKATEQGQKTVIIALTASAFEEERNLVLSEGCDDFVRKPFREAEIFERMGKFLGVKYLYAEPDRKNAPPAPGSKNGSDQQTLRRAVQTLAPELLAQLNTAAAQADSDSLLELLSGLRASNPELSATLEDYVHNFRFDLLMLLAQPGEGE